MMLEAAKAIAAVAKLDVPQQIKDIYKNPAMKFGPDYILPTPFDNRLLPEISGAVAKSAVDLGHAKVKVLDIEVYKQQLKDRVLKKQLKLSEKYVADNVHAKEIAELIKRETQPL